jgi:hypothetical protein
MKLRSIHFTRRDGSRLDLSIDEARELFVLLARVFWGKECCRST